MWGPFGERLQIYRAADASLILDYSWPGGVEIRLYLISFARAYHIRDHFAQKSATAPVLVHLSRAGRKGVNTIGARWCQETERCAIGVAMRKIY